MIVFKNVKFANLPISVIYRIIQKAAQKQISSDLLYDFIKKSINKFCTLFSFLNFKNLSENKLVDLCEFDDKSKADFGFLKCNLELVMNLIEQKKNLQNQLDLSKNDNNQIQKSLNDSENEKGQLQKQLKDSENEKSQLQKQLKDSENEKSRLQKQLEEKTCQITGKIVASIKNDLIFNAQINLLEKGVPLDKSKSKYIVSTSNEKMLGFCAYEEGEPITSLNMTTIDFGL